MKSPQQFGMKEDGCHCESCRIFKVIAQAEPDLGDAAIARLHNRIFDNLETVNKLSGPNGYTLFKIMQARGDI